MSLFWIPLAGLFALDRRAAFNFMLSRPIVVSAIMGSIGGHLAWCLIGGIFFEIIGLLDLPVGTRISRDDTFAAFAYSMTVTTIHISSYSAALLALIISFIIMLPVTLTISARRHLNETLLKFNAPEREWLVIVLGEIISFMRGMVVYSLGVLVVIFCYGAIYPYLGEGGVPIVLLVALACLFCGYFSQFFQTKPLYKILLLLAGGGIAWLIP